LRRVKHDAFGLTACNCRLGIVYPRDHAYAGLVRDLRTVSCGWGARDGEMKGDRRPDRGHTEVMITAGGSPRNCETRTKIVREQAVVRRFSRETGIELNTSSTWSARFEGFELPRGRRRVRNRTQIARDGRGPSSTQTSEGTNDRVDAGRRLEVSRDDSARSSLRRTPTRRTGTYRPTADPFATMDPAGVGWR